MARQSLTITGPSSGFGFTQLFYTIWARYQARCATQSASLMTKKKERQSKIKNLKLMKKPKSLVFFIINSKFIFLFLDRREIIFIEPYTLIVKIKMVSNLWLTVLLVVTIFLGLCVGESFSFFTTPTTMSNNPHVTRRATTAAATALLVPSWSSLSSLASTVIDSPTITEDDIIIEILKDSETKSQEKNGKDGWEIRLFNDPMNHRTFVAKCLNEICGKSDSESYQIMMQAHKSGMGIVGRYPYEIAELYYGSLKAEGLTVDMVQVDDE